MAIAVDATSGSSGVSATLTWSHTCTGSNLILFVGVSCATSRTINSVTYNSVGMTSIASVNTSGGNTVALYYLLNPATGANNIAVTLDASGSQINSAASYTGAKQSGVPDASDTTAVASGTSVQGDVTTTLDNCWITGYFLNNSGTFSAGSGTTLRESSAGSRVMADTNAAKTPAGAYTISCTWTGASDGGCVVASFAPALASTVRLLSLTGIGT